MNGEAWIARNPGQLRERLEFFRKHLEEQNVWPICWTAKKYTDPRSVDQNALYWLWVTHFAQHLLDKNRITADEKESMAYTLQRRCYAARGWEWLIETPTDLVTGEEGKPQRRSTKKFLKGEFTMYLEWVQQFAAERGLILESLGEYRELQERQVA